MEKECSRCQAGDNPNHTHNTEYGKLARSKSKSSLSNPNHTSYARSRALEKKYAPSELKTIGQNYKKLFDEQRYVDNRSSRRKHAREYNKEHGTKDNR
jgi:hypothetical protein